VLQRPPETTTQNGQTTLEAAWRSEINCDQTDSAFQGISNITASTLRSHSYRAVIVAVFIISLAAGLILSFWPGIMTWDAITQLDQATRDYLEDWHPPVMAWIWRQFIPLLPGPAPMFLLQLLLYSAGFALTAGWALARKRYGLAIALATGSLSPITIGLMAAVLKDCLMLGALLAATGLFLWSEHDRRQWTRTMSMILLLFASTLRFNAFLACFPIATALMPDAFRRTRARLIATALAAIAALLLAMPLANRLLNAQPSGVELSLIIFDLGGITEHSGADAFPPLKVGDAVAANHHCYSSDKWDYYSSWSTRPCAITFDNVRASFEASDTNPIAFWIRAIVAHPIAYIEHRLDHLNINTLFLIRMPLTSSVPKQIPNIWNYSVRPNVVQGIVDKAAWLHANTPLGWPICWLALAVSTLMVGHRLPSRGVIVPIASSALAYGLGYAVLSVSSEIRYHLWTMAGTWIAAAIAMSDIWNGASVKRRQLYYAATPVLMITALATLWHFVPA
jgi:hypothetical protein